MPITSNEQTLNPVDAYFLTTFSPATIESCKYRMQQFCDFTFNTKAFDSCDWASINYTRVLLFISFLKEKGQSYTSINTTLAVIKSVSLHCWQLDYIDCDTYMRIKTLKKAKGSSSAAGRTLTIKEINTIKNYYSANNSDLDRRDYAIFALAVGGGLRRNEIRTLDFNSITNDEITVTGKNNHTRTIPLSDFTLSALKNWLKVRGNSGNAIFTKTYANSIKKRIGLLSIHRTNERIVNNTGLSAFTGHDLRRTFATLLLDENADKFAVKFLLGHSSIKTTDSYDRNQNRKAKETIDLLPF